MNDFRNVAPEQKRELGQALNELKTYATERINALREAAERGNDKCGELDLTRTPAPPAHRYTPPAVACTRANHRHLPPSGLHYCRRP